MVNLVSNYIFNNEINKGQTKNREDEIKCGVVILYQISFKQMLNKVGKVFKNYRTNTRQKPNHNTY